MKAHRTDEYRLDLQKSIPEINCYKLDDNHFAKDCPTSTMQQYIQTIGFTW